LDLNSHFSPLIFFFFYYITENESLLPFPDSPEQVSQPIAQLMALARVTEITEAHIRTTARQIRMEEIYAIGPQLSWEGLRYIHAAATFYKNGGRTTPGMNDLIRPGFMSPNPPRDRYPLVEDEQEYPPTPIGPSELASPAIRQLVQIATTSGITTADVREAARQIRLEELHEMCPRLTCDSLRYVHAAALFFKNGGRTTMAMRDHIRIETSQLEGVRNRYPPREHYPAPYREREPHPQREP